VARYPNRKLAVILHADVCGSTALVRRNEVVAHERMTGLFRRLAGLVRSNRGIVREIRGDALVAEFRRASDAVAAACTFQSANTDFNGRLNDDIAPVARIGIAIGESLPTRGAVSGTGVVMAQRAEQVATPGSVCITAAVHEALPTDLPFRQQGIGERHLKGFDDPVRLYLVELRPDSAPHTQRLNASPHTALLQRGLPVLALVLFSTLIGYLYVDAQRTKPVGKTVVAAGEVSERRHSLVVMPFEDLGSDGQHGLFADGITEDLITDLSGLSELMVIASNTSFALRGQKLSAQNLGADLGVDYVLEGSVRRSGDAVRVNAQLVDTRTGFQKWASRFDRRLDQVFAVQDELVESIVAALAIQLTSGEEQRLARRTTDSLAAYDFFQEGQRLSKASTRQSSLLAQKAYRAAIDADPEYGRAYGALAYVLAFQGRRGWSDSPVQTYDQALAFASKAVVLSPELPQTHWALGYVHLMRKEYEAAEAAVQGALDISPSYADGYGLLALIKNSLGQAESAAALIRKGMKLNPYYTWDYPYNLGRAYYAMGQPEQAIPPLEEAKRRNENVVPIRLHLAAAYVAVGRLADAEWEAAEIQVLNPGDTLSHLRRTLPMRDPALLESLLADLKRAGLPE
jgi:adenylate cyclase